MESQIEILSPEKNVLKARIFFVAAFVSSFLFYYFMTRIDPVFKDWFPGRIIIAIFAFISFLFTYSKRPYPFVQHGLNCTVYSYIALYGYFLWLNDWSMFHRWSYFVVVAILITTALSWRQYLYQAVFGLLVPFIVYFLRPIPLIELTHFQAATVVTYFVIGITIRANMVYKEKVIQLTKAMVENSKMVALGEMSGGLAHEINNPLAVITLASTQLNINLKKLDVPEEKYKSTLGKIHEATGRITHVVNGLRQFAQAQESKVTDKVDLQQLFDETISFFSEKLKIHDIHLIVEKSEVPLYCFGTKAELGQIFFSLLNNAFDSLKHVSGKREILVQFLSDNKMIKMHIQDSGPGVPKTIQKQIFEPFFTTKDVGQGTGLGLSSSLGIAKSLKGDLYLCREISPSCFTLILPKATSSG